MATLLGSAAEALKSQKESIVKIVNIVAALELDPESRRASQEGGNHGDRLSSMRGEVDDIKVTVSRMEASLAAQGGRGGKGSASQSVLIGGVFFGDDGDLLVWIEK